MKAEKIVDELKKLLAVLNANCLINEGLQPAIDFIEVRTAKPKRCDNCLYWKPDYGTFCMNGWSEDGTYGHCHLEPRKTRQKKDSLCHFFEPE